LARVPQRCIEHHCRVPDRDMKTYLRIRGSVHIVSGLASPQYLVEIDAVAVI
jgi:enamine deaminase RidA (YjgF/YER057c/UK114 family)